jgi:uncharacterized protein (TIGR00255 family)
MLVSMTAFAQKTLKTKFGTLSIEIQSLNGRFLTTQFFMPKEFLRFDMSLRQLILKTIERGQITVSIKILPSDTDSSLSDKIEQLKKFKKELETICQKLNYKKTEITFPLLLEQYDNFNMDERDEGDKWQKYLEKGVKEALDDLIVMKTREGVRLSQDIQKRIVNIADGLKKIEKESQNQPKLFKEKLMQKLADTIKEGIIKEEDMAKEIAFMASRVDISEEVVRLNAHIKAFYSFMQTKESLGKKLDFLLQEMLREVNTMVSKSQNGNISTIVIEIKSEIEKIKEQVQNIE